MRKIQTRNSENCRDEKQMMLLTTVLTVLALLSAYRSAHAEAPASAAPKAASGPVLTLDQYLSQVEGQNQTLKASKDAAEGAAMREGEGSLVTLPSLFGNVQWIDDQHTQVFFPYQEQKNRTYSLGVQERFSFGLNAKLSYGINSFEYIGMRPLYYEASPQLELSLSLLRNGFGSETRAQKQALEAGAQATRFQNSYQVKVARAQAESAYIQLATARALIEVDENSLSRAQQILDWSKRRSRLNLGESADLYQAQANYESRSLALQSARDQERVASRAFNQARQIDGDAVAGRVVLPEVARATVPARAQLRDDTKAAIAGQRAAAAQANLGAEKNKPDLELYGSYARTGRKATSSEAISNSLDSSMPTTVVGVRFVAPLAFGKASDTVHGYRRESDAAERLAEQKKFDQEVQWTDLVNQLSEAKRRYEIATGLEEIQRKKAESERTRLRNGRTTTFQLLTFELDYDLSQAEKIRARGDVLGVLTQLKTFQGE